ncbi:UDP-2,3-diacylglucosamine diphosphatase [Teredinibacter sp. KSP-S5-2]|uniref:UDP-2,3-diacylglucosamine diphosphatase n=1 Tax=Teredinibacter sp. KSP-S5-2 TaxID=3034506 RepID=UPI00293500CA|nr:UDP-2,3-diacylglucosamine diphosphatase [Teredinibacter sp. KSP-S5-2]WNO07666.1 UDP-2,3-diacylglucosamine diphosphatase [Teredinibacter sp. KSP-S5-2]
MTTYFISDLHLSEATPKLYEAFCSFVDSIAKDADALYILGDFFDAWVGDDDDSEICQTVKKQLKQYTDAGLTIYFMVGNRDFLLGETFAQQTGVTLLEDPSIVEIEGQTLMLMHGDSLCIDDFEYMQFRAQVRNPLWQQQALAMPLEQRRAIAAQMRNQSKTMNSNKAEDIMDVNNNTVINLLAAKNVFTLVHGHTHRPDVHTIEMPGMKAKRYVLGDWGDKGWYIKAENGELELVSFDIK